MHDNGLYGTEEKTTHLYTEPKATIAICGKILYKNKDRSFWNNVIFSDESKFEVFGKKKSTLLLSVEKLGLDQSWIFQQDNDSKYTAIIVKEWLLYCTPKQLDHPHIHRT